MFDLEKQIVEWRRQLAASGIKRREVLDELEAHLREDVAQQIQTGVDAQRAFEAAVRRMGEPRQLKTEFAKASGGTLLWRIKNRLAQLRSHADAMPDIANFTADGQQTLSFARQEAPLLHHDFIGTEHLLLGLTKSETGIVPNLMQRLGVDSGKVSAEIQKWVGLGQPAPRIPSEIPFTPRAKRALSFAAKEAGALNQTQIGAEHIFLWLLLEGHGVAGLVLKSLGVDAEKARREIRRSLAGD
ncbi:MAG TPA: Clp protease N-terminal domain-containing protein [Verrucomicrobiae bacterium]|nr:Clp protease N-terminal domain-containing protein [Verrucomicrobiae bacterium]